MAKPELIAWLRHPITNVECEQNCGIGDEKMVLCANGFAPQDSPSLTAAPLCTFLVTLPTRGLDLNI